MATEKSGLKSLRIFFSYSSKDKELVGRLKDILEGVGFEVFIAHEDIDPCIEWQDEIIKNLKRCDIFIPVLTNDFINSEWTHQETGIAIAADKFIIPLQVDIPPTGFIGKIQSFKINKDNLNGTARKIVIIIKTRSSFSKDIKEFMINSLINSGSFSIAKETSELLEDFEEFSKEEINKIVTAIIENNQIYESFGAQKALKRLLPKYKDCIETDRYNEVMKLLK